MQVPAGPPLAIIFRTKIWHNDLLYMHLLTRTLYTQGWAWERECLQRFLTHGFLSSCSLGSRMNYIFSKNLHRFSTNKVCQRCGTQSTPVFRSIFGRIRILKIRFENRDPDPACTHLESIQECNFFILVRFLQVFLLIFFTSKVEIFTLKFEKLYFI